MIKDPNVFFHMLLLSHVAHLFISHALADELDIEITFFGFSTANEAARYAVYGRI